MSSRSQTSSASSPLTPGMVRRMMSLRRKRPVQDSEVQPHDNCAMCFKHTRIASDRETAGLEGHTHPTSVSASVSSDCELALAARRLL